jgi:hypothetical protein
MRLLLYAYAIGESSSWRAERATYDNVAFRYLADRSLSGSRHDLKFSDRSIWRASADCLCSPCSCVNGGGWGTLLSVAPTASKYEPAQIEELCKVD